MTDSLDIRAAAPALSPPPPLHGPPPLMLLLATGGGGGGCRRARSRCSRRLRCPRRPHRPCLPRHPTACFSRGARRARPSERWGALRTFWRVGVRSGGSSLVSGVALGDQQSRATPSTPAPTATACTTTPYRFSSASDIKAARSKATLVKYSGSGTRRYSSRRHPRLRALCRHRHQRLHLRRPRSPTPRAQPSVAPDASRSRVYSGC